MEKPRVIFIVLVVVVAVTTAYLLLDSFFSPNVSKTPMVMIPNGDGKKTESKSKNTIVIRDFRYYPNILNVKLGDTVTWVNEDGAVHTVTSDTFNSQNIKNADFFKHKFIEAGIYDYICKAHPYMKGRIVVGP